MRPASAVEALVAFAQETDSALNGIIPPKRKMSAPALRTQAGGAEEKKAKVDAPKGIAEDVPISLFDSSFENIRKLEVLSSMRDGGVGGAVARNSFTRRSLIEEKHKINKLSTNTAAKMSEEIESVRARLTRLKTRQQLLTRQGSLADAIQHVHSATEIPPLPQSAVEVAVKPTLAGGETTAKSTAGAARPRRRATIHSIRPATETVSFTELPSLPTTSLEGGTTTAGARASPPPTNVSPARQRESTPSPPAQQQQPAKSPESSHVVTQTLSLPPVLATSTSPGVTKRSPLCARTNSFHNKVPQLRALEGAPTTPQKKAWANEPYPHTAPIRLNSRGSITCLAHSAGDGVGAESQGFQWPQAGQKSADGTQAHAQPSMEDRTGDVDARPPTPQRRSSRCVFPSVPHIPEEAGAQAG